jgi:hypothetical protein
VALNDSEPEDDEDLDDPRRFNPEWAQMERVCAMRKIQLETVPPKTEVIVLVKWNDLGYDHCTWEVKDQVQAAPGGRALLERFVIVNSRTVRAVAGKGGAGAAPAGVGKRKQGGAGGAASGSDSDGGPEDGGGGGGGGGVGAAAAVAAPHKRSSAKLLVESPPYLPKKLFHYQIEVGVVGVCLGCFWGEVGVGAHRGWG